MANLYTQDNSPGQQYFARDFNTHHPAIQKFVLKSNKINLQAPLISQKVKQIQASTSITSAKQHIQQLGTIITRTATYRQIFVEMIPKDNECTIELFPTPRRDPAYNFRIQSEKPNSITVVHSTRNMFNYFQTIHLGFKNRYGNQSRGLIFDFIFPLKINKFLKLKCNWKTKKIDESTKTNSINSQFVYSKQVNNHLFQYKFKVQNRSNTVQKHNLPTEIETSNLYQLGFNFRRNNIGNFTTLNLQSKLGIVPIKESYFAKFKAAIDNTIRSQNIGFRHKHIAEVVVGKNIIANDLIEYRPMNRAEAYFSNKFSLYLLNYPHAPISPLFTNIPYTYIKHWTSYNRKREKPIRSQFQLGVGALMLGHDVIGVKFSLQFSCIRLENKKLKWAPGITIATGDK